MFEFFVALFGGVHYGGKILAENAEAKRYDNVYKARFAYHEQRQQQWKMQVADRALEEDLERLIADPHNYADVWEEVHAAYLQMPTHKSYTTILLYEPMVLRHYGRNAYTKKERENIASYNRRNALDIMLANRGKVRHCNTLPGTILETLERGNGEHSMRVWDEILEHWVYIRDALRRNGVDARLIFKMGVCGEEHQRIAYDVDNVEQFRYKAGQLTWLPLTFYDENLQYMRA